MKTLTDFVEDSAKQFIIDSASRAGKRLDFSDNSLNLIEEMLEEACGPVSRWDVESRQRFIEIVGCYILEVGRAAFGGHYVWHNEHKAPVLIVGDSNQHVALLTWPRVAGRLSGDLGDNIPYFYEGFAETARGPKPDLGVLYV